MDVRNKLLVKFFSTFTVEEEKLIIYCEENNVKNSNEIILEFNEIRKNVFDYLWKLTEPNIKLFPSEIEVLSENYLKKNISGLIKKE